MDIGFRGRQRTHGATTSPALPCPAHHTLQVLQCTTRGREHQRSAPHYPPVRSRPYIARALLIIPVPPAHRASYRAQRHGTGHSGPVPRTAIALSIAHARPAHRASCGARRHGTGRSGPVPCTAIALSIAHACPAYRALYGAQRYNIGRSGPVPRTAIACQSRYSHLARALSWPWHCVNGPHPTRRASYRSSTARGPSRPGVAYATVHAALYHACAQSYVRTRFFSPPSYTLRHRFTRPHATAGSAAGFFFRVTHFICAEKKRCPTPRKSISCFAHILQNPMAKTWTW